MISIPCWKSLNILDLSCGDGEVLEKLNAAGGQAEGTHYRADDYIYRNPSSVLAKTTIHKDVNLCKPLPFSEASYDVIMATEVFEHLESHSPLCYEVGRVLKPGGYFIVSTPNIHRLSSRLLFAWTGQLDLKGARLSWEVPASELYSKHHNPVYFPTLHTLLYQSGLYIEKIGRTKVRLKNKIALVLFYPIIYLSCRLEMRHLNPSSPNCARDLFRWLVHPNMLINEHLVLICRKGNSEAAVANAV